MRKSTQIPLLGRPMLLLEMTLKAPAMGMRTLVLLPSDMIPSVEQFAVLLVEDCYRQDVVNRTYYKN